MNIRLERVRLGMTQADLAKNVGVSVNTITRWEARPGIIPGAALLTMADLFGCSADYLLERTDERGRAS